MRLIQVGRDKKPFLILALSVLVTLSVLAFFLLRLTQYSTLTDEVMRRSLDVRELRGQIVYLDEALTMSARLAVLTGAPEWQARYRKLEPKLDAALANIPAHTKTLQLTDDAVARTDAANQRLTEMEHRAFDLLAQGKQDEARNILFCKEYAAQKAIYAEGMVQLDAELNKIEEDALASDQMFLRTSIGVVLLAVLLLILLWLYVLRAIRGWKTRLLETNRQLELQGAELQAGTEALRQEMAERQRAEKAVSHYFNASLDMLGIAGFDGYFKRLNPAWEKVLGWNNEELCAQPYLWLFVV